MSKKPRILFLPKYPRMGASSRLRTFQFVDLVEEEGFAVDTAPFFNQRYLKQLYKGRRPAVWNVLGCYVARLGQLLRAGQYDVLWVEKEVFPYLPAWAERWLPSIWGVKVILDYDDAVFHNYDLHEKAWVRRWLGDKIAQVMQGATIVMAGSPYLEAYATQAGARKIVALPTVVAWEKYQKLTPRVSTDRPVIGWIGSPSTQRYLEEIVPVLERVSTQHSFTLMVVNGREKLKFAGNKIQLQWTEDMEASAIQQFDIGIMPLPDNDWERGKCAYKLIQYMACGLPVVASPVGVNVDVVQDGVNGFLAASPEEWEDALIRLLKDTELRKSLGQQGRQLVASQYTVEHNMKRIREVLKAVL